MPVIDEVYNLDDSDFLNLVEIVIKSEEDTEKQHILLDGLMETVLLSLGYKEAIKKIRETVRWYS